MIKCYYKEIKPNYFVWCTENFEPHENIEYEIDGEYIRTIDEYIQLPLKKIRIRYPDIAVNRWFGCIYYSRIMSADNIITYDGRVLSYNGYSYSSNYRIESLSRFLNSLYGDFFVFPRMSYSGKHYEFVIEYSTSNNGYDIITTCSRRAAKRWKERSNWKEVGDNAEDSILTDSLGLQYIVIHFNRLKKIIKKDIAADDYITLNLCTNNPLILFGDYQTKSVAYRVYNLKDFIPVLVNGTNPIIEKCCCRFYFILIALCEYYYSYFEGLGIKVSKNRFRNIIRGCAKSCLSQEERQIKVNSLLLYIIELTSKIKI